MDRHYPEFAGRGAVDIAALAQDAHVWFLVNRPDGAADIAVRFRPGAIRVEVQTLLAVAFDQASAGLVRRAGEQLYGLGGCRAADHGVCHAVADQKEAGEITAGLSSAGGLGAFEFAFCQRCFFETPLAGGGVQLRCMCAGNRVKHTRGNMVNLSAAQSTASH